MATSPKKPVKSAVEDALLSRLGKVHKIVSSLKKKSIPAKVLHNARVVCRRSEAALLLCQDLLKEKSARQLRRQLKILRTSCNATRDRDVLHKWLQQFASEPALKTWKTDLKNGQQASLSDIHSAADSLARELRTFKSRQLKAAFHVSTAVQLRSVLSQWCHILARFVDRSPVDQSDLPQLHQYRIAAKRLRYATEFLSDLYPATALQELIDLLKQMQQLLGEIQDATVRCEWIQQSRQSAKSTKTDLTTIAEQSRQQALITWGEFTGASHLSQILTAAVQEVLKAIST